MKKVTLKTGVKSLGYEVVKLANGYNYRGLYAKDNNGQLWHFFTSDLRSPLVICRRKVASVNDTMGEHNMFDVKDMLAERGLYVHENRRANE